MPAENVALFKHLTIISGSSLWAQRHVVWSLTRLSWLHQRTVGGILADEYHLHGNSEARSPLALLLIDLINDMEFDGGDDLRRQALPAAEKIARLKRRARAAGVPVIYVNDNFGQWQSDFTKLVRHCLEDGVRGEPVARLLLPDPDDFFVLKPKSSAFFDTTLDTLLQHLGTKTLVLTGVAADVCILFTAHDAHLRDYQVIVPSDCVASEKESETAMALKNMQKSVSARVLDSGRLDFQELLEKAA
jgi:nicotinamidase-related amidase